MDDYEKRYVIMTAAHNEGEVLEATIDSVRRQTVPPVHWVIVNDNSADATGPIIDRWAQQLDYLQPLHQDGRPVGGCFGSKLKALRAAYAQLESRTFGFLAILDADIRLPEVFYERLMARLAADETLGIAGGWICESSNGVHGDFKPRRDNRPHMVPGAVQVFKREVWDSIGGLPDCPHGGEDTGALAMAWTEGWRSEAFKDLPVHHLKPTGAALGGHWRFAYNQGVREYHLGVHPLYAVGRSVYRSSEWPFVVNGAAMLCGYLCRLLRRQPHHLPEPAVATLRRVQLRAIKTRLRFRRSEPESAQDQ